MELQTLLNSLASLGVGGILAGIVIWWKRQDDEKHLAEWRSREEQHRNELQAMNDRFITQWKAALEGNRRERRDNTEALRGLIESVTALTNTVEKVIDAQNISERLAAIEARLGSK